MVSASSPRAGSLLQPSKKVIWKSKLDGEDLIERPSLRSLSLRRRDAPHKSQRKKRDSRMSSQPRFLYLPFFKRAGVRRKDRGSCRQNTRFRERDWTQAHSRISTQCTRLSRRQQPSHSTRTWFGGPFDISQGFSLNTCRGDLPCHRRAGQPDVGRRRPAGPGKGSHSPALHNIRFACAFSRLSQTRIHTSAFWAERGRRGEAVLPKSPGVRSK
ncbi:hypothetical protein TGP89_361430 [Toxoplasma gondii p89]|uniref:Uncharacterized protein n=1 Tax=Toxoplasma gondii p89 TaxID=943119 RepID=A0A086L1K8_TOXGO|nr:hypothetical protein TGP89_361430 [Toxoplasma gondii p89]